MGPRDEFEEQQLKDIGTFFAQLRYKKGKTQRGVGSLSNIGQAAVTKFEKAQSDFRFTTLQALAKAYGYRVQLTLIPIGEGEDILVEPDPNYRTSRHYPKTAVSRPKKAPRKKKVTGPILSGPQVEYDNDDEFDTAKEMAALRQRLGIVQKGDIHE